MKKYILDACGLIAFLNGGEGYDKLLDLLNDTNTTSYMHAVNLGEVYYDLLKKSTEKAKYFFNDIGSLPISIIWIVDRTQLINAGLVKTRYKMSYADSFALALPKQLNASLITSDHHEFDIIEKNHEADFFWLR